MSGGGGGGAKGPSAEEKELWAAQTEIARGLWDSYQSYGAPILADLSEEAQRPLSAYRGDMAQRASEAATDVDQAFDTSIGTLRRDMGRFGADPTSGRYVGTMRGMEMGRAAAKAGAMTGARRAVRTERDAKRFGALSATLGQPAQAVGGMANVGSQMGHSRAAMNQANATRSASMWGALGNLGGAALGAWILSDDRAKSDIKKVGKLDNGLTVYSFRYDDEPDGPVQIGLMADEVRKVHPEAVAEDVSGLMAVDYDRATQPAAKMHPRKRRRQGAKARAVEGRKKIDETLRNLPRHARNLPKHAEDAYETVEGFIEDRVMPALDFGEDEITARIGAAAGTTALQMNPRRPKRPKKRAHDGWVKGMRTDERHALELLEDRISRMSPEDKRRLALTVETARRDRALMDGTMTPEEAAKLPALHDVARMRRAARIPAGMR